MVEFQKVSLSTSLKFFNGKAVVCSKEGKYPVYGSNGVIGTCNKKLFENAIIVGRVGAYCGSIEYCGGPFWASDNTIVIKAKEGYDNKFFSYLLKSAKLNRFAGGAAQPLLTHGWLKPLKYLIPPLPTQKKIAKVLSAYDDLIENNLRRIKLLEEMAQKTYEEWFVHLRFPGHETTPINPETGLPEGWIKTNLGSKVEYEIGGGWGEDELTDEANSIAYVIRGTDFGSLKNGELSSVPIRYHKKSNLRSRILRHCDIVFEVSGGSHSEGVAKTAFITEGLIRQFGLPTMCASFCKLLRCTSEEMSYYYFHFLRFLRSIKATEVFELRSASNIVNFNWTAFLKFQIVNIPNDELLREFALLASTLHSAIIILGNEIRNLKEAREILLPHLVTGKVDIDEYLAQNKIMVTA